MVHDTDPRTEGIVAMLAASSVEYWPEVDRFLRRRDYRKWAAWGSEILRLVGPGSQFTWQDVGTVCRDDEALTRPVESPKGFRSFVLNARIERINGGASNGTGRLTNTDRALNALKDIA